MAAVQMNGSIDEDVKIRGDEVLARAAAESAEAAMRTISEPPKFFEKR